jgi:hypothetical protein
MEARLDGHEVRRFLIPAAAYIFAYVEFLITGMHYGAKSRKHDTIGQGPELD